MKTFKAITCPRHRVIVARIDAVGSQKAIVYWQRTTLGDDRVLGGRAAEKQDEKRLALDDPRVLRNAIPYFVTWCPKCRKEYVLPKDWVLEQALHSGSAIAPDAVLPPDGVLPSVM